MATDETLTHPDLLAALDASDWSVALHAVDVAEIRIRDSIVGDPAVEVIVAKLVALASHRGARPWLIFSIRE